jgi:hypothetical protein
MLEITRLPAPLINNRMSVIKVTIAEYEEGNPSHRSLASLWCLCRSSSAPVRYFFAGENSERLLLSNTWKQKKGDYLLNAAAFMMGKLTRKRGMHTVNAREAFPHFEYICTIFRECWVLRMSS